MVKHILVIDDDWHITELLRRTLAHNGYTVTVARDGEAGLKAVIDRTPDLIILDIMLPGLNGLQVCQRLREGGTTVPVLMLTALGQVADKVTGLREGADDYLVKPFALDELLARVGALLRRGTIEAAEMLRFNDVAVDTASHEVKRGERTVNLSTTEFMLLQTFLRNPRILLSRSILMERVWGYDFGGDSNVLDVYIGYLRTKLEANGEPRIIQTVRGAGYVLRD